MLVFIHIVAKMKTRLFWGQQCWCSFIPSSLCCLEPDMTVRDLQQAQSAAAFKAVSRVAPLCWDIFQCLCHVSFPEVSTVVQLWEESLCHFSFPEVSTVVQLWEESLCHFSSQEVSTVVQLWEESLPLPCFSLPQRYLLWCSFSFSFSSRWHRSARKGPYALRPVSRQSPQGCPRNSANICLVERISFSAFEGGMSAASFLHSSFLQAVNAVMLWQEECLPLPSFHCGAALGRELGDMRQMRGLSLQCCSSQSCFTGLLWKWCSAKWFLGCVSRFCSRIPALCSVSDLLKTLLLKILSLVW